MLWLRIDQPKCNAIRPLGNSLADLTETGREDCRLVPIQVGVESKNTLFHQTILLIGV